MLKNGNKNLSYFLPLVLILFLTSLPAYARSDTSDATVSSGEETILFQDIPSVYGASKYEQKVTEAPSSVTIITYDEIRKYGYRTLTDLLRSVRGFYITYDRNYNYIGVRGFSRPGDYNTRILLMVDGHEINDNIYDSVLVGTEFILDVDLIERVEIIRGPSSSLYGSNAFFGIVNVITKRGRDFKGIEASAEAGSFDTYKGRLSFGNKFKNGMEMLLSGSIYDSDGQDLFYREFNYPPANNGVAEGCDYDRYHSFFYKLSFHDFTLNSGYVSRQKGIPTASYETLFNDRGTYTIDRRSFIDLKYEHTSAGQTGVMARAFYDYSYYKGNYIFDYPPVTANKDFAKGEWWGWEFKFITKLAEHHKLIAGAEYRKNLTQSQSNYDRNPFFLYLDDERKSWNWALYIQDELTIIENLVLNLGLRHDYYKVFGGSTNPRLALIFSPLDKTTFKLIYGKAFRTPNTYELYYDDGGLSTKSNPDLKPEKINTYEIILEQYLGDHTFITVSGFYNKIRDLISQTTDPADNLLVFKNIDEIRTKGIEFEIDGRWPNGVEGRISYTFQESMDQKTGEILTNSPGHLGKLNIIVPLLKEKLYSSLEVQYTAKRKTLKQNHTDDFFITNITLFSRNILRGLEISGSVYNLFDKKYGDPGAGEHLQDIIQQDGRGFRLKLTYSF